MREEHKSIMSVRLRCFKTDLGARRAFHPHSPIAFDLAWGIAKTIEPLSVGEIFGCFRADLPWTWEFGTNTTAVHARSTRVQRDFRHRERS